MTVGTHQNLDEAISSFYAEKAADRKYNLQAIANTLSSKYR